MYDISSILSNLTKTTTIKILTAEYLSIAPFLVDHVKQLNPLESTNEGRLALSKIHFALGNYAEAIRLFTECDDSFYMTRMHYRMMCAGVPLPVSDCDDSLGYLFDNGRFDEMMKFSISSLFLRLLKKSEPLHKHFVENYKKCNGDCKNLKDSKRRNNRISDHSNKEKNFYDKPDINCCEEVVKTKIDYFASFGTYDNEDRYDKIYKIIEKLPYPYNFRAAYYTYDNYPVTSRAIAARFRTGAITTIFDGSFLQPHYLEFLVKNNKTDFNFLNSLGRHNTKFDPRLINLLCNCMMNISTTNDSLYRSNENLLDAKQWNKFVGTAALGIIHCFSDEPYEILKDYLPSEADLKRGGSLYALGLIGAGEALDEDIDFLTGFLVDRTLGSEIVYGALLGTGLCALGTSNTAILDLLLRILQELPELLVREGTLLAIGLINVARSVADREDPLAHAQPGEKLAERTMRVPNRTVEEMITICENMLMSVVLNSEHEREARTACISLALGVIGSKRRIIFRDCGNEDEEAQFDECCLKKSQNGNCCGGNKNEGCCGGQESIYANQANSNNEYVRYAIAMSLGTAFCGTGDIKIIGELLDMTRDGDLNVSRIAVFSIGLVCCEDTKLLGEVLTGLATHYSPVIRGAVALSLGLFNCGTGRESVSNTLEALLYDNDSLVVQQVALGLGFLFMQTNSFINKNFKRIIDKINSLALERVEDGSMKFGVLIGRALMEGGGTNCIFSVLSNHGAVEPTRVAGALLFFHHWYWYPYFPFICLCVTPTVLLRFDSELALIDIDGYVINEKRSKFNYESIKIVEHKKQRRFRKREVIKVKTEVEVEDEDDWYVIGNGDRITKAECVEIGKKDFRVEFE